MIKSSATNGESLPFLKLLFIKGINKSIHKSMKQSLRTLRKPIPLAGNFEYYLKKNFDNAFENFK